MNDTVYLSPIHQLVLLLICGAVSSLVCGISACVTVRNCERARTCTTNGLCSFTNIVSLAVVNSYNASVTADGFASMLRGVCAPGERMTSLSNTAVCVPYFQFPDAYNREIEDVSASSEHMKACGSWIKAGGLQTVSYTHLPLPTKA